MDGEKEEARLSFATALNNKYTDYEPKLFDSIQLSPKRRGTDRYLFILIVTFLM